MWERGREGGVGIGLRGGLEKDMERQWVAEED